jgi:hypothetical protein
MAEVAEIGAVGAGIVVHAVAVDGVAVEVKGDVVGSDHDPVVGTVDQVVVQRGVRRDGLPADINGRHITQIRPFTSDQTIKRLLAVDDTDALTTARIKPHPDVWDAVTCSPRKRSLWCQPDRT